MKPTLFHRVFSSFLGIWLGLLLKRPENVEFSVEHALIFLVFIAFLGLILHVTLVEETPYERRKYLIVTLVVTAIIIFAVNDLENSYYPANRVLDGEIIFLGGIVFSWIGINEVLKTYFYNEPWLAK